MTGQRKNNTGTNYTHVSIVLDRSGSMQTTAQDTIGGFNQFLKDQKEINGRATITLVQFDDEYNVLKDMEAFESTSDLDAETYVPRGWTALLDAIGKTINRTEAKIKELAEDNKPNKVIFVIITDGKENTSREFTRENIMEMIRRHEKEDGWQFVFIGANQDAIKAGDSMGIRAANSLTYGANSGGVKSAYASMSRSMTNFRTSVLNSPAEYGYFSNEDREEQEKHGVEKQSISADQNKNDIPLVPPEKEQLAFYQTTSSK